MLNVYEQIDANKKRTGLIMAGFSFFVVGFIYLLSQLLESGPEMIFLACVFSLASSIGSYFWGDKIVLSISKAKPASKEKHYNFFTAAENLAIAAQIPTPKLFVINSAAMNAFATGRNPKNAVVCATTGLIENLNKSELEAVIAHEISHITNYDILLSTVVAVLVGMITLVSDWALRGSFFSSRKDDKNQNPAIVIVGLIAFVTTPIAAKLIQLALSRQREYFADATAAKLTRFPQGLISALEKLEKQTVPLRSATSATAHLYIANPFGSKKLNSIAKMFSTHPPTKERIAALKKML